MKRLEREAGDDQFRCDIELIAVSQSEEDRAWRDAMSANVLRALDEEDGGYDWGRPA